MRPLPWKALAAVASGLALGMGLCFLRTDWAGSSPASCQSCHTMREPYGSWRTGAHHQQACTECHLPQTPLARTLAKGSNGLHHSVVYALGREGVYPRLAEPRVVEANCRRCHPASNPMHPQSSRPCLDCHRDTAHGVPTLARR